MADFTQMQAMQQAAMMQQQQGGANPYAATGQPMQAQQAAMMQQQQQGGANPYAAAGQPMQAQQAAMMQQQQGGTNPYAAAGQPMQGAPQQPSSPLTGGDGSFPQCATHGTVISVSFSDGTMLGYDKLRRSLIATGYAMGSLSTTTIRQMPARPNPPGSSTTIEGSDKKTIKEEAPPAEPVRKEGHMTKLGFKKGMMGMESWQERYFVLDAESLTYSKGPGCPDIKRISLSKGMSVNVRHATSPANRDRFENPNSMSSMLTQPMGSMLEKTMGVVGKDNCVELSVPPQVGKLIGTVTSSSPLAMMGKMNDLNDTRARTYYMSCNSAAEAEEWCRAIQNNIDVLPQQSMNNAAMNAAAGGGMLPNGVNLGQVDAMVNYGQQMQNMQAKAGDPNTSLDFFKFTLACTISTEELYQGVSMFYDELARNCVRY